MWLLKTESFDGEDGELELIQAWDNALPPYAILSHRWSKVPGEEVSFADVQYLINKHDEASYAAEEERIKNKPGYIKIAGALRRACADGWRYLWVDTCCIDKSSSADLSEAINSMFRYYSASGKCYAYLSDIDRLQWKLFGFNALKQSEYFHRGWTLQELLAPSHVEFVDQDWNYVGRKTHMAAEISQITGIAPEYLRCPDYIFNASIAERMSWAARRRLTRDEDIAYCLLGIFEVNMSLLYGEGKRRAFLRLQEEIIKRCDDQTIFAWCRADHSHDTGPAGSFAHGLLADGPEHFANSQGMMPLPMTGRSTMPTMTARGLHIFLPLLDRDGHTLALLRCMRYDQHGQVAVYLTKNTSDELTYTRRRCHEMALMTEPGLLTELYVSQDTRSRNVDGLVGQHLLGITDIYWEGAPWRKDRPVYTAANPFDPGTPKLSSFRIRAGRYIGHKLLRIWKDRNIASAGFAVDPPSELPCRLVGIAFGTMADHSLGCAVAGSSEVADMWMRVGLGVVANIFLQPLNAFHSCEGRRVEVTSYDYFEQGVRLTEVSLFIGSRDSGREPANPQVYELKGGIRDPSVSSQ